MQDSRTISLIGKDKFDKLVSSHVLVVGVGGVGGYTAEMLVRAGVGNITIVDFDVVDVSNINRQIIALHSTIGLEKVEVLKNRLLDINPNLNIFSKNIKFCENSINDVFCTKYDFVVDAIDDVINKALLIKHCKSSNINIVSAMGAGLRSDIPDFEVCDIFSTHDDALSKKMRKALKDICVFEHNVVYSSGKQTKSTEGVIGSISYSPAMCGCVLSAYVINKLVGEQ